MLSSKFVCLWISRDIASLGGWVLFVALLGWTYQTRESAAIVSIFLLGQLLPPFLLRPLARMIASGRTGQWVALSAQLLSAAALYPLLSVRSVEELRLVLLMATLAAVPTVFVQVAHEALLPALVSNQHLRPAEKAFASTKVITMVIGCAAGTVLFDRLELPGAATIALVAMVLSAALLVGARPGPMKKASPGAGRSAGPGGLAHALRQPPLRAVLAVLATTALTTGGLMAAQTGYMVWGVMTQPSKIGFVLAATGVGIIAAAAIDRPTRSQFSSNGLVAIALGISASAAFGFAISSSILGTVAFAALMGLGSGLLGTSYSALVEKLAPPEVRSAVTSGIGTVTEAAALLSAIAMGPLADSISPRFAIVAASIILAVLALYSFGAVPDQDSVASENDERDPTSSVSSSVPA